MTDTIDAAMMIRLQGGDRTAYEELWSRWRHRIFQFLLRRTGSRQHAEDAFQRTWLKVYKYRVRIPKPQKPKIRYCPACFAQLVLSQAIV